MKGRYSKLFKLAVALALVAGLVPLLAAPAQACIIATIDPVGGPPGTEVVVSYGNTYRHAWEWGNPAIKANSTTFGGIQLQHDMGRMQADTFVFTVPNVPPGDYDVHIIEATQASWADITFTVTTGEVIPNPFIDVHINPADAKHDESAPYDPGTAPLPWDAWNFEGDVWTDNSVAAAPSMPTGPFPLTTVPLALATPAPTPTTVPLAVASPAPTVTPAPMAVETPAPTVTPAPMAVETSTAASTAGPGRLWLWLAALLVLAGLVVWGVVRQRRKAL